MVTITQDITKLQEAITDRQLNFADLVLSGISRVRAHEIAGFEATNYQNRAKQASRLLVKHEGVKAYYRAIRAEKLRIALKARGISRQSQLEDLERAKELSLALNKPKAYTSAVKEQNAMMGYQRELAPNREKEALHELMSADELKTLREFAHARMLKKAKSIECKVLEKGQDDEV